MKLKRRIARLVAKEVPDRASLFINIGTTTEAVAIASITLSTSPMAGLSTQCTAG